MNALVKVVISAIVGSGLAITIAALVTFGLAQHTPSAPTGPLIGAPATP